MRTTGRQACRRVAVTSGAAWLMAALALGLAGPSPGADDPFALMGVERPGKPGPAPDLRLLAVDGRTVSLEDFEGKVVLLGFFTTT